VKIIVKIFFIIGIAFGGFGLLYSFSKLIALNGIGDIFEMNEARNAKTEIIRDSTDISILYTYQVEGKVYQDNYKMVIEYFEQCGIDTIVVKYNKHLPMVSYIDGVPLKIRQQKIGMFLSSFYLLFLILLWKFSNKDKRIKTYEEVGNRPWLYPGDQTIKNPFRRFVNRLFKN